MTAAKCYSEMTDLLQGKSLPIIKRQIKIDFAYLAGEEFEVSVEEEYLEGEGYLEAEGYLEGEECSGEEEYLVGEEYWVVVGCLEVGLMVLFQRVSSSENPSRPLGHLTNEEEKQNIEFFVGCFKKCFFTAQTRKKKRKITVRSNNNVNWHNMKSFLPQFSPPVLFQLIQLLLTFVAVHFEVIWLNT